jgi:hypothetical protein
MHYRRWQVHGTTDDRPRRERGTCSVQDCGKPTVGLGLCSAHWQRQKKRGTTDERPSLEQRFWSKVDRRGDDECWPWTAGRLPGSDYGQFWVASAGQNVGAHRVAYELLVGPIPEGAYLDHLCRNHPCVNPAHLEPVTCQENLLRGETHAAANASKTHCPEGHPYDETNTYHMGGRRICRTCSLRKSRAAYFRRRTAARIAELKELGYEVKPPKRRGKPRRALSI